MSAATKTVKKAPAKSTKAKASTVAKPSGNYFYGVGRRKTSVVRAKYYPSAGSLSIMVEGKTAKEYFQSQFEKVLTTFLEQLAVREGVIELFPRGGGMSSQADASRLAMAKALIKFNEGLKPLIRAFGYSTTDIRNVLPKRPGLRKARKREQWSKR